MDGFGALRRKIDRVSYYPGVDASQCIWWIHRRAAVAKVLEKQHFPELTAALSRRRIWRTCLIRRLGG